MLDTKQPAYENGYRETYSGNSVIYNDVPNGDMRKISSSPLLDNFDSSNSHKGSCKPGNNQKVFSGPDYAILSGTILPARSLKIQLNNATAEKYESVVEEQIFRVQKTKVRSCHTFSNNIWAAINVIKGFNDLSTNYIPIEGLAVYRKKTIWTGLLCHM